MGYEFETVWKFGFLYCILFTMEKIVKKYNLTDKQQETDNRLFWQQQSVEYKIEVLESLREDAIKLGLYPDHDEGKQRLRRLLRVTQQK